MSDTLAASDRTLPDVDVDAPRPCGAKRFLHSRRGFGEAHWLVHQKCPACGSSVRDWLCDGCWRRTEQAIESGEVCTHRCGHTASVSEFIASAVTS